MEKPTTPINVNICPICKKTFSSKWSVIRHVDSTHHKKKFLCQLCNKIFAREDYLVHHLKNTHDESILKGKKGRVKKQPKRKDKSKPTECPDSTTVFNSVSYKNETSIHDDNTNFEAEDLNVGDIEVSVTIKSDEDDSILSVNWEDSLPQFKTATATERLHVEDRSYNRFTGISRSEQLNSEQIRENSQLEDMSYNKLLSMTNDAIPNATQSPDLQIVPLIKATNDDCISINSDDEDAPKSRPNKSDNQSDRRPAESEKRTRGENDVPLDGQSKESDGQAGASNSSKRSRGENDVLVDSNVFDLLKRRTLDSNDEDRMFLLSILSDFKKVLPQNKLTVKIKIAQAISDGS